LTRMARPKSLGLVRLENVIKSFIKSTSWKWSLQGGDRTNIVHPYLGIMGGV
jgi:hypothetical protein